MRRTGALRRRLAALARAQPAAEDPWVAALRALDNQPMEQRCAREEERRRILAGEVDVAWLDAHYPVITEAEAAAKGRWGPVLGAAHAVVRKEALVNMERRRAGLPTGLKPGHPGWREAETRLPPEERTWD